MSEESKYANDDRLIGTSLSRCMAEMAKNGITVREVARIVASTRILLGGGVQPARADVPGEPR